MFRNATFFCYFVLLLLEVQVQAQSLTGNFAANGNMFIRDTTIGAFGTPQYDRQKFGAEAWLNLVYSNWGFDFGVRFDMYNNSNLINPNGSYSAEGIGNFFIRRNVGDLRFQVGYIYDQIGSGMIYRAYEERALAIDNALIGAKVEYDINDNWTAKAFAGRQKRRFEIYESAIKGGSLDGFLSFGTEKTWSISPGIGFVNRTLDDETQQSLVTSIGSYILEDQFSPVVNTYAVTLYNTLTIGDISWYIEGAYKTKEAIFDLFADKINSDGTITKGKYINTPGSVIYTSLSYAKGKFGVTAEVKRTDYFYLRALPLADLNTGTIAFLPPMTRQNTYRMTARYNAATQELGELALQLDLGYKFSKKLSAGINMSYIDDLDNNPLYREIYSRVTYEPSRAHYINAGVQLQATNQAVYLGKPDKGTVYSATPFVEYLYKISRRQSIRVETQYTKVDVNWGGFEGTESELDYGDWLFALAEYSIAPKWIFTIGDMFNINPRGDAHEPKHYPTIGATYIHNSNRISLNFVKQVEGVVCTGGICRLEPAFSGFRLSINSTF